MQTLSNCPVMRRRSQLVHEDPARVASGIKKEPTKRDEKKHSHWKDLCALLRDHDIGPQGCWRDGFHGRVGFVYIPPVRPKKLLRKQTWDNGHFGVWAKRLGDIQDNLSPTARGQIEALKQVGGAITPKTEALVCYLFAAYAKGFITNLKLSSNGVGMGGMILGLQIDPLRAKEHFAEFIDCFLGLDISVDWNAFSEGHIRCGLEVEARMESERERSLRDKKRRAANKEARVKSVTSRESTEQQLHSIESAEQQLQSIESAEPQLYSIESVGQQMYSIESTEQQLYSIESVGQQMYSIESTEQQLYSIESVEQQLYSIESMGQKMYSIESVEQQLYSIESMEGAMSSIAETPLLWGMEHENYIDVSHHVLCGELPEWIHLAGLD
jgi:hypothetical protein